MKGILALIFGLSVMALNSFGQGQILFQANSGNGLIQYSTDLETTGLYPLSPGLPGFGNAHVGFYTAPNETVLSLKSGLPDFTGWTANTLVLDLATGPGKTGQTAITVPNAANNVNVELELVTWNGTATSWVQALGHLGAASLLGFSGMVIGGHQYGALGWSQPTGDFNAVPTPAPPAPLITGAGGYGGLVVGGIIPEPSATALGGLGLILLGLSRFIFRRRTRIG